MKFILIAFLTLMPQSNIIKTRKSWPIYEKFNLIKYNILFYLIITLNEEVNEFLIAQLFERVIKIFRCLQYQRNSRNREHSSISHLSSCTIKSFKLEGFRRILEKSYQRPRIHPRSIYHGNSTFRVEHIRRRGNNTSKIHWWLLLLFNYS